MTKNKGGRPPHQPTEQTRQQVIDAKCLGYSDARIIKLLRLGSKHTLYRHYREELNEGRDRFVLSLMKQARTLALGYRRPKTAKDEVVIPPDTSMLRFLLARVGNLKETTVSEVTGKDGGPIQVKTIEDLFVDDTDSPAPDQSG